MPGLDALTRTALERMQPARNLPQRFLHGTEASFSGPLRTRGRFHSLGGGDASAFLTPDYDVARYYAMRSAGPEGWINEYKIDPERFPRFSRKQSNILLPPDLDFEDRSYALEDLSNYFRKQNVPGYSLRMMDAVAPKWPTDWWKNLSDEQVKMQDVLMLLDRDAARFVERKHPRYKRGGLAWTR